MGEDKRGGPVRGTLSIVLSEDLKRGREGRREGGREGGREEGREGGQKKTRERES